MEPILFLWNRILTFYYTRVRPQCDFSILGRIGTNILDSYYEIRLNHVLVIHKLKDQIHPKVYAYLYSLLHFFNLESQSIIFSVSLLPSSVEKRPERLRLEIEIKWHSNAVGDLSSSAMACSKKTNTPLPPDIFSPGTMVCIQPTPPPPTPESSSPGAMVCVQDKNPAVSKAVVELVKAWDDKKCYLLLW